MYIIFTFSHTKLCFLEKLFSGKMYKNQLAALFLSDLILFCSFVFNHPLYFSYFVFFSPYIIRLLSFLSPLFITTSLLIFILLTVRHSNFSVLFSASKQSFFLSVYHMITEKLPERADEDEEEDFKAFEEFEVYKIVFDTSSFDSIQEGSKDEEEVISEKPLDTFFKELDEFEDKKCISVSKIINDDTSPKLATIEADLGAFGSSRKEKEWKRTLACKLFEERNNVGGDEGMDSLWETYETNSSKSKPKNTNKKLNKMRSRSKSKVFELKANEIEDDYDQEENDDDENDDDDEDRHVQLCCLQAFKFSTGKMNLGMGKPNLVKFSKVFKGIGWLHHASKNSKKR